MSDYEKFWKDCYTREYFFVQVIIVKILSGNNSLEPQIVKYVHVKTVLWVFKKITDLF